MIHNEDVSKQYFFSSVLFRCRCFDSFYYYSYEIFAVRFHLIETDGAQHGRMIPNAAAEHISHLFNHSFAWMDKNRLSFSPLCLSLYDDDPFASSHLMIDVLSVVSSENICKMMIVILNVNKITSGIGQWFLMHWENSMITEFLRFYFFVVEKIENWVRVFRDRFDFSLLAIWDAWNTRKSILARLQFETENRIQ